MKESESPQRKLGDCSDPFYMRARTELLNPTNGSWWIVQIQPPKQSAKRIQEFSFMPLLCKPTGWS
jgi:hypothetical protein